ELEEVSKAQRDLQMVANIFGELGVGVSGVDGQSSEHGSPLCRESQVVLHKKYTGASLRIVTIATGHRLRWTVVWVLVVAWFVATEKSAPAGAARVWNSRCGTP